MTASDLVAPPSVPPRDRAGEGELRTSRTRLVAVWGIVAAGVSIAGVVLWLAFGSAKSGTVPLYTVQPGVFSRRVTAEGNLKAQTAMPLTAPIGAPGGLQIAWIAPDGTQLRKGDLVVRFDATDFGSLLVAGNEDRQTAVNKLTKTSSEASTTKTNLLRDADQARTEVESAKRFRFDDAEIFSLYQRVESEVDQTLAGERRDHAVSVLGVREKIFRADRDLVAIDQHKADLKVRNAEKGLSSLELRAPYDGILVLTRDWRGDVPRVGATIWPGGALGEIPDLSTMKAEVYVLEADASGIAVGQKAEISLDSQPGAVYRGKIAQMDKLARPRVRGVPVQYFGVTIELDRTDPRIMKPGTRVRAQLELDNRTKVFSIPRQALFEKEGKTIVYRRRGIGFEPMVVTIAASSAGRVVVTQGLSRGDQLALVAPAASGDEKAKGEGKGGRSLPSS
ncbi:MAG TPA: HlyD family efflux transporter periplasmic adaptor subunit [Thermoanaerobaculia bacterium]|nr:HlyD family efflux transporter periplasmic adaptor subunit [Thermoanaerobaculia bacterium]